MNMDDILIIYSGLFLIALNLISTDEYYTKLFNILMVIVHNKLLMEILSISGKKIENSTNIKIEYIILFIYLHYCIYVFYQKYIEIFY